MADMQATILLREAKDWPLWAASVRKLAVACDVLEYVDPEKEAGALIGMPTKPEPPSFKNGDKELSSAEINHNQFMYKLELAQHEKIKKGLLDVSKYIERTVPANHQNVIRDKLTAAEQIQALKAYIKPTDHEYKRTLSQRYNRHDCKALKMPEVSGTNATLDFIDAARNLNESFYSTWVNLLAQKKADFPDLNEIVGIFRRQMEGQHQTRHAHAATLQGKAAESSEHIGKTRTKCPCGHDHSWSECPRYQTTLPTPPSSTTSTASDALHVAGFAMRTYSIEDLEDSE